MRKVLLWIPLTALFWFGIADHDVWTPDEPRETRMASEMASGSSWLIPHLAGEPFIEKPPLYYWLAATAITIFSGFAKTATIVRGVSSFCCLATVLLIGWFSRRMLGLTEALASMAVLATMGGFLELSHWIRMDSVLTLLVTAAIVFVLAGLTTPNRLLLTLGVTAAAGAFLTKGFIAWALIAPAWLIGGFLNRKTIYRYPLTIAGCLIPLLGPALAWGYAYYASVTPELWRAWFWDNQIGRFLGRTRHLGHIHGPGYYLPLIILVTLPWTPRIIGWLTSKRHAVYARWSKEQTYAFLAVAAWSLGGLLVLSVAGTKRSIYLFPLLPGFALLAGWWTADDSAWLRRIQQGLQWFFLVIAVGVVFLKPAYSQEQVNFSLTLNPRAGLWALWALGLVRRTGLTGLERLAGVTACCYLALIATLIPFFDGHKNYEPAIKEFVQSIPQDLRPNVCGWNLDQTTRALIPYYCNWTVTTLYDEGQLRPILEGRDPRFTHLIIQGEKRFPPKNVGLGKWSVEAEVQFPTRRNLQLIRGAPLR